MSFKPTIAVLIIAALGVAAVVYVEQREAPAGPLDEPRTFLAADQLPVDAVDRITLRRGDEPEMVFQRSEQGWAQVAPFPYPMDKFSIHQLAVLARDLVSDDEMLLTALQEGESLEAIGLDPPAGSIRYDWPDGSVELKLGRQGVAGRAYLLVTGDDTIHVVNQGLHDRAIEMDPKEWRDRTIFTGVSVDAERVERAAGEERMELVRDRKQWNMALPVSTRLDPLAQDEFFQALGRARCDGFIADQPADLERYGLVTPVATVSIITAHPVDVDGQVVHERETQTLLVGSEIGVGGEERFGIVEGRPVVVRLSAPVLAALFAAPEKLADHTGSGTDPADVKSVVIRTADDELMLSRDLERWLAPAYDDAPVPRDLVEELLQQLTTQRAEKVVFAEYPYDLEFGYVTLHGFDGKPKDTVRIVRDPETGNWAFENGDGVLRLHSGEMRLRLTAVDFGLE